MTSLYLSDNGDMCTQDDLTITTSNSDTFRSQLCVVGDLDDATCGLLGAVLEQQLAAGRRYVRVDVSGVPFIDTAGVAVLVEMHRAFLARRGTMIILGAGPRIRRVLALLELDGVLLLAADLTPFPSALSGRF
jgi:anti-anti-sigma factor